MARLLSYTDEVNAPNRGDVFAGRFELIERLGRGSFATVWKAADRVRGETVALKILLDRHVSNARVLARFEQEAKILERLDHANIARAVAWSADPAHAYVALEYIEGETLDTRLREHAAKRAPIPELGLAWITDQLCTAVAHAHGQGIVHRDLKPQNVIANRRGQSPFLKVLDFGVAKILLGGELDPTTAGKILGSVLYIAPEMIRGEAFDHRADIFSLGTILFEVATLKRGWARDREGRPLAFDTPVSAVENNHAMVLRRISDEPPPSAIAERPELPRAVDDVLSRAMDRDPNTRFATADELARAMRLALLAHVSPR